MPGGGRGYRSGTYLEVLATRRTKLRIHPLRTWRAKVEIGRVVGTSDLEGEIGDGPLRTSRSKLRSNSDLEFDITSDLQGESGSPRAEVKIAQGEIEILQGDSENQPGRN